KEFNKKLRIFTAFMLLFLVAIFYWQPLFLLFSLLKDASSYWYRYSYVSIFFLIWLAGYFFASSKYKLPSMKVLLFVPFIWLILQSHHGYNGWGNIFGTSIIFMCLAAVFYYRDTRLRKYSNLLLVILVILDLGFNANYLLRHQDAFKDVQHYHDYVVAEKKQIASVAPTDNEFYRITQTKTYLSNSEDEKKHTTANYNEGMAYRYPTIASYTSSPVNAHLNFLDKLGYRRNGDNMNIVNTSLLGVDALFGVQYVLADYPIAGLTLDKDKVSANDKNVYDNPFAMPMAFRISDNTVMHHDYYGNPFQFTNELYTDIFQQDMDIYRFLDYKLLSFDGRRQAEFQVSSNQNGAVYGNFPFQNKDRKAFLTLNDDIRQFYAGWCAPSVFYLPLSNGIGNVKWQSEKDAADAIEHAQFYQVDEGTLASATAKAWAKAAQIERDSDTHLRIHVDAEAGEKLFTSIPVHKGWQVIRNGEKVKPEAFEDCLMVIPLEAGHNEITLDFELPEWKKGLCISLASVVLCLIILGRARFRKCQSE
ncbi:YfhO family protein, partial [Mitsuokella sp.]|uniref:YfhO family protein n=1 Tax=Mitsuokella sp. TaxID=2049034 RepID=UPI003D7EA02F